MSATDDSDTVLNESTKHVTYLYHSSSNSFTAFRFPFRSYSRCRRHPFMVFVPKPYVLGTETVKGRRLETDFGLFNQTLVHSLPNKFTGENQNSLSIYYRFRVLQPQWDNQIPCHSNKPLHTSQLANQVPASTCAESHKNRAETHIQHILKMRIFVPRQQAHDGRKRKNTDYRR